MANYKIAVVVGSLRKESFNQKLANGLIRLAPPEFSFHQVQIRDLPLYDQDDDANPAESVRRFKSEIQSAHAVLFLTPEYNRSFPGVLKNAIDHGSRPYGQGVWTGKPAGVLGASIGAMGTALAQQHLRSVLAYLDMPTMNQPEAYIQVRDGMFDEQGNIGPASTPFLQKWIDQFAIWVRKHVS